MSPSNILEGHSTQVIFSSTSSKQKGTWHSRKYAIFMQAKRASMLPKLRVWGIA
jgi:hypothetical protein